MVGLAFYRDNIRYTPGYTAPVKVGVLDTRYFGSLCRPVRTIRVVMPNHYNTRGEQRNANSHTHTHSLTNTTETEREGHPHPHKQTPVHTETGKQTDRHTQTKTLTHIAQTSVSVVCVSE